MKNYYSILGVTPDSTDSEIKSAYRVLARKFHPDLNPDGVQKFKDISEAYETLSNHQKRLQYDTINGFFKSSKNNEKTTQENKTRNEKPKSEKRDFTKNFKDFNFFGDIGKKKKKPQKGNDINEEIFITQKESIEGSERIVNILHTENCPHCKGRKFINGTKCQACDGTGEKNEHKRINVKIPQNIKNGTKLRIQNEGKPGKNGGKNGDLYIKINIKENAKSENLSFNVPITPFEAVLGGNIKIPLSTSSFTLKIPPNTRSGQKFRLAEQGRLPNGKYCDIIVSVYIEIPSSLSDDEIRLYEKLKKLSSKNIRENIVNE